MNLIKRITDKLRRKPLLVKPAVINCVLAASCGCKIKNGKVYEMCGTAKYKKECMEKCYDSGMQMIGRIEEEVLVKHLSDAIEQTKHCL